MTYTARFYRSEDDALWDAFLKDCPTATFLHSRRFLAYHGSRFVDRSLLLFDNNQKLYAVMPAAIDPGNSRCVVSHPGATYGGLLLGRKKAGIEHLDLLQIVGAFLAENGFDTLIYKGVPQHLHTPVSQADLYALWRHDAQLIRRDLWNVVDLSLPPAPDENRRRHVRRAQKNGVVVVQSDSGSDYERFYPVLIDCLSRQHSAAPVHSLADMQTLQRLFSDKIRLWLALDQSGEVLAGEWIFMFDHVHHGQYGAATQAGRQTAAQDLLLHSIIDAARQQGTRYFSFGASTEQQGKMLNEGLYRYKAGFGPGSVVQDFYHLALPCTA